VGNWFHIILIIRISSLGSLLVDGVLSLSFIAATSTSAVFAILVLSKVLPLFLILCLGNVFTGLSGLLVFGFVFLSAFKLVLITFFLGFSFSLVVFLAVFGSIMVFFSPFGLGN
jgi:hypothetical protein